SENAPAPPHLPTDIAYFSVFSDAENPHFPKNQKTIKKYFIFLLTTNVTIVKNVYIGVIQFD
ncbi:MAG: hypothetical protein J6Y20_15220, partial [Lachnospiraceae bacterium]|nr:hypothetical protein [Lachnospiraceae bacterium]